MTLGSLKVDIYFFDFEVRDTPFEGLMGFAIAFDPRVHAAKKHRGQQKVAKTMRSLTRNKYQTRTESFKDTHTIPKSPQKRRKLVKI